MTYHSDPTRWTQSPGDAPELLRSGLEAASHEGPSDLQMRALTLKLAAVGAGAAVAVGAAAGAKASTTMAGAGLAASSGGALSLTKIAVSVALVAAAAAGGTMLLRAPKQLQPTPVAPLAAAPLAASPVVAPEPVTQALPARERVEAKAPAKRVAIPREPAVVVEPAASAPAASAAAPSLAARGTGVEVSMPERSKAEYSKPERRERRHARTSAPEQSSVGQSLSRATPDVEQVAGAKAQPSEIDLLSKARAALAARPREAYRLTEEHKDLYPQGMFGQERDALAVEALQRAGDLKLARELAEAFVKRYPSSPHAHRFRETMNLP